MEQHQRLTRLVAAEPPHASASLNRTSERALWPKSGATNPHGSPGADHCAIVKSMNLAGVAVIRLTRHRMRSRQGVFIGEGRNRADAGGGKGVTVPIGESLQRGPIMQKAPLCRGFSAIGCEAPNSRASTSS